MRKSLPAHQNYYKEKKNAKPINTKKKSKLRVAIKEFNDEL